MFNMGLTLVCGCILDDPSTETDLDTVAEAGKGAGTLVITGVVGGHSEPELTAPPGRT